MINGHFTQFLDELRVHGQHFIAFALSIKEAFPIPELIKLAVIAVVTSVLTSNVTTARLEERQTAITQLRDLQIKNRDIQIRKMDERDQRIEERLNIISQDIAALKARMK